MRQKSKVSKQNDNSKAPSPCIRPPKSKIKNPNKGKEKGRRAMVTKKNVRKPKSAEQPSSLSTKLFR